MDSVDKYLGVITGAAIGAIIFIFLVLIAFLIFSIVGKWKLFKKAGKNGWEAIIPFYSTYIMAEVSGLASYWGIISIILTVISGFDTPLANIATILNVLFNIAVAYNLSKKFKKNDTWFVLAIFFSGILIPILGYSKTDEYDSTVEVSENAFFSSKK